MLDPQNDTGSDTSHVHSSRLC